MKLKLKIVVASLLFSVLFVKAQYKVAESNSINYTARKDPKFSAFCFGKKNILALKYNEQMLNTYDLFQLNEKDELVQLNSIKINAGSFKNMYEVISLQQLGNKFYAFIENKNKEEGFNKLIAKEINIDNGYVFDKETVVASFPYEKMGNCGKWHVYNTEDKKHTAIVAELPTIKKQPQDFSFYFIDETLKVLNNDAFTVGTGEKSKDFALNLFASNEGKMFLVNVEFDKSYKFPVVYSKKAGEKTATETLVMLPDPNKNFDYTTNISKNGDLIIVGVYQEKKTFSFGETKVLGQWFYNSSNGAIKTLPFEKPLINQVPKNVEVNGNQIVLMTENVKKENVTVRGSNGMIEREYYKYTLGNMMITAFDMEGENKSDVTLTRSIQNETYILNQGTVSGIYGDKFTLIHNDDLEKYNSEKGRNLKVPVTINFTKQNLMEKPTAYITQFNKSTNEKYYSMVEVQTQLGAVTNNGIIVFSYRSRGNSNEMTAYMFR